MSLASFHSSLTTAVSLGHRSNIQFTPESMMVVTFGPAARVPFPSCDVTPPMSGEGDDVKRDHISMLPVGRERGEDDRSTTRVIISRTEATAWTPSSTM